MALMGIFVPANFFCTVEFHLNPPFIRRQLQLESNTHVGRHASDARGTEGPRRDGPYARLWCNLGLAGFNAGRYSAMQLRSCLSTLIAQEGPGCSKDSNVGANPAETS